jgi:serine/threonine-protein kinase
MTSPRDPDKRRPRPEESPADEAIERFIDSKVFETAGPAAPAGGEAGWPGGVKSLSELERIRSAFRLERESAGRGGRSGAGAAPAVPGYQIIGEIGKGGFATVYRARDLKTERVVALKLLDPSLDVSSVGLARFRREAKVLASLRHENIVSIYHVIEVEGTTNAETGRVRPGALGLAMELIEGETLAKIVERQGPFPPEDVAHVGLTLCRALEEVHLLGYVHRDVKAANVMRTAEGRLVLLDFGLTRSLEPGSTVTDTGILVGTPLAMAPEQYLFKPIDARTDIYSLGCVLFQLAAGCHPVSAASMEELRQKTLNADFPTLLERRPAFPPGLAAIIHKAMAVSPADRFTTTLNMEEELQAWALRHTAGGARRGGKAASQTAIIVLLSSILALLILILGLLIYIAGR